MKKMESLTAFNNRAVNKSMLHLFKGGTGDSTLAAPECTGGGFELMAINDGNQSGHPGQVQLVYLRWGSDTKDSSGIHKVGKWDDFGPWTPCPWVF
jgi:hypothetical protein